MKEYSKPMLVDLSEDEMRNVSGGCSIVAVFTAAGLAVAVLLVLGVYTVAGAGVVVGLGGVWAIAIGAVTTVTTYS